MDESDHPRSDTWHEERVDTVDALRERIGDLENKTKSDGPIAWRGHAKSEWKLESTLDRKLQEIPGKVSYEDSLHREQAVLAHFRHQALPYADDAEKAHLSEDVWTALAFGRHAGLATRLLDWTWSPWVAAWFVCHKHRDADGVLWWFNQKQFERIIHVQWDGWGVPSRATCWKLEDRKDLTEGLRLNERVLEATAFNPDGHPWVTKIHHWFPCSRMRAQQGFTTACGRLRISHNEAIDELLGDEHDLDRGRIVIGADIKGEVLAHLRTMDIHARSLEYPGIGIVARAIKP